MQVEEFCRKLFDEWLAFLEENTANTEDMEATSFTKQAGNADAKVSNAVAENLKQKIKELPDTNCRVVHVNLQNHDNFGQLLYEILQQIFDDPKFSPRDTRIKRENWEKEQREEDIGLRLKSVIANFAKKKIRIFLIVEHFELAAGNWNSSSYGWMRDFVSGMESKYLSVLVLSDRRISEVSMEPAGSSPLFNVFEQYQEVV